MTIRLQASIQSLVFVIMLAATLFGTAGRIDIIRRLCGPRAVPAGARHLVTSAAYRATRTRFPSAVKDQTEWRLAFHRGYGVYNAEL